MFTIKSCVATFFGSSLHNCLITPVFYVVTTFASTLQGTSLSRAAASFSGFLSKVINGGFPILAYASLKASVFHHAKLLFTVNFAFCSVLAMPEDVVILGCCVTRLVAATFYVM